MVETVATPTVLPPIHGLELAAVVAVVAAMVQPVMAAAEAWEVVLAETAA